MRGELRPGDRVRVRHDTYYDGAISAGRRGFVQSVSSMSHATANGGGYDATIELDTGRVVILRWDGLTEWADELEKVGEHDA